MELRRRGEAARLSPGGVAGCQEGAASPLPFVSENSLPPAHWTRSPSDALPVPEPVEDDGPTTSEIETAPPAEPTRPSPVVDRSDPRFETEDDPRIPDAESFRIGTVAEVVGVRPHVLRFWETEFDCIAPTKTSTNQRRYSRADVARLLRIRRLRHEDGLTVPQARALLEGSAPLARVEESLSFDLGSLRERLADLREAARGLLEIVED